MDQNTVEPFEYSQKIYEKRLLIYYEHLLDSWMTSRMEYDKSLFLISMGGVGLLTSLLMAIPSLSFYNVLFFVLSISALLVSAITIAYTFSINSNYTKYILADSTVGAEIEEKKLKLLRYFAVFTFGVGIALALGVGIVSAFNKF